MSNGYKNGLTDCELAEVVPGKVSGVPLLVGTRSPVEAITENHDAFLEDGLSSDEAIAETLDCYSQIGMSRIEAILAYRAFHQLRFQP